MKTITRSRGGPGQSRAVRSKTSAVWGPDAQHGAHGCRHRIAHVRGQGPRHLAGHGHSSGSSAHWGGRLSSGRRSKSSPRPPGPQQGALASTVTNAAGAVVRPVPCLLSMTHSVLEETTVSRRGEWLIPPQPPSGQGGQASALLRASCTSASDEFQRCAEKQRAVQHGWPWRHRMGGLPLDGKETATWRERPNVLSLDFYKVYSVSTELAEKDPSG